MNHRLAFLAAWVSLAFAWAGAAVAAPCSGQRWGAGYGTFYHYTPGTGACSFAGDDDGPYVAALNAADYAGSLLCGAWLHVTGPLGSVDVRIVDQCNECAPGDLDLDDGVFGLIGNPAAGRVPITWTTIADPTGSGHFLFESAGTNAFFLQVQPRHSLYAVARVEYLAPSGYVTAKREVYDEFTVDGSIAPVPLTSPFTVRLTDVNGQQVVASGVPIGSNHVHPMSQFPVCEPLSVPGDVRPGLTALRRPAPNPFQHTTRIAFETADAGAVLLRLYDAGGRRVRTLVDARLEAGPHELAWDGRDDAGRRLAAGLYFVRLATGGRVDQVRITRVD